MLVIFTGTNKIQVNNKIRVAYEIEPLKFKYDKNSNVTLIQTDGAVATNISHFWEILMLNALEWIVDHMIRLPACEKMFMCKKCGLLAKNTSKMGENHTFFTKWTSVAAIFTTNQNRDLLSVIFIEIMTVWSNYCLRMTQCINRVWKVTN